MSELRIHPDAPFVGARLRLATALACAGLALPSARAAEPPPPAAPTQPVLAAPFERYQAWREEPVRDWREVNDRVGEIGGWRTYLRESQGDGGPDPHGEHGHH